MLSGGGGFGKFHFGIIKALNEQDLMPRIIVGSSVGSAVATLICITKYEDIDSLSLFETAMQKRMVGFKKGCESYSGLAQSIYAGDKWLCMKTLKEFVTHRTGNITFLEIYEEYGWVLNINVTVKDLPSEQKMLNYLTAPNVVVWSACLASCSIPWAYDPQELFMKNEEGEIIPYNEGKLYVDGSVSCDLPMQRISELWNVNTFIVSQVNPHTVPFVWDTEDEDREH